MVVDAEPGLDGWAAQHLGSPPAWYQGMAEDAGLEFPVSGDRTATSCSGVCPGNEGWCCVTFELAYRRQLAANDTAINEADATDKRVTSFSARA